MNGHIDIRTLTDYFLNRLSPEEETRVQEHLSSCPECAWKLEGMRRLRQGFFGEEEEKTAVPALTRILRSGWTRAAAAVIIIAGIGVISYETVRDRDSVFGRHQVQEGNGIENQVFAIDTFDKEDSIYYREKYGDGFFGKDSL